MATTKKGEQPAFLPTFTTCRARPRVPFKSIHFLKIYGAKLGPWRARRRVFLSSTSSLTITFFPCAFSREDPAGIHGYDFFHLLGIIKAVFVLSEVLCLGAGGGPEWSFNLVPPVGDGPTLSSMASSCSGQGYSFDSPALSDIFDTNSS